VNEQEKTIELQKLGIQIRQDEMVRLQTENSQIRSQGTSWYSNPFIFAAIGVIVGAYAGARATR
jgi:hypothetical protein